MGFYLITLYQKYFNHASLDLKNHWMFPKQTERKYHFIVKYSPLTIWHPEPFSTFGYKHEFYGFFGRN